tara:strand:+ start:122 stop:331 length:210 start_codon:yes stop_codon:yes gene_type:complete
MTLEELKKLAGVGVYDQQPKENMSITGTEKRKKERELGLRPGDPAWFKLWFSRPYLTGPVNKKFKRNKK